MADLIRKPAFQLPRPVMTRPPRASKGGPTDQRKVWFTVLRRKWQIIAVVFLTVAPTALYNFWITPIYLSTARIQVDPEAAEVFPYKGVADKAELPAGSFDTYFQTQVEILKGDKLSHDVASRLMLNNSPEGEVSVTKQLKSYFAAIKRGLPRKLRTPLKGEPLKKLGVRPIPKTRLIELSYSSSDPAFAAVVVNTAAEEFIRLHFREKDKAAERAVEALNNQLRVLGAKVEKAEQDLIAYAHDNRILNITDEEQDVILQRLQKLNEQMTQVESQYIAKIAQYNALKSASPAELPSSLKNPVIDELERRLTDLEQKMAYLNSQFDENWPEVVQMREQIARVQDQLVKERNATHSRALRQAGMEYEAARQEYQMVSKALQEQKDTTNRLNQASVEYNNLKREVDTNKQLYQALLQRLKETGVAAGPEFSSIRIIEPAMPARAPSSPRKAVNLALALTLGLVMGIGLASLNECLDRSLKSAKGLEDFTGLPSLASVPLGQGMPGGLNNARARKQLAPITSLDPAQKHSILSYVGSNRLQFREACLHLRTSILLANPDQPPQVILLTSAIPLEGKTTMAAQLGNVLARADAPTILLDLDMRRPELSRRFGANGGHKGMSVFLSGNSSVVSDLIETENPYLILAPAGPRPPNPVDLIGSKRMKLALEQLRRQFRFIVIDTPPVLTVSDARALASMADGVVLVVRAGKTPRDLVARALVVLRRGGGRILGLVFNGVDSRSPDNYYDRRYYGYSRYETERSTGRG